MTCFTLIVQNTPSTDTYLRLMSGNTHLNLGSCLVMIPTSSSEGLKSMDSTAERHEIEVCCETRRLVKKARREGEERKLH